MARSSTPFLPSSLGNTVRVSLFVNKTSVLRQNLRNFTLSLRAENKVKSARKNIHLQILANNQLHVSGIVGGIVRHGSINSGDSILLLAVTNPFWIPLMQYSKWKQRFLFHLKTISKMETIYI